MAQWTTPGEANLGAVREDLSDIIRNVSPSETPFLSAIGTSSASAISHDWPKDTLAAPTVPAPQAEGVTFANLAVAGQVPNTPAVTRLSNIAQIDAMGVDVAGTVEAISKAGRDSQMAYQTAKRLRELKTRVDKTMLSPDGAAGVIKSLSNVAYNNNRTSASLSTWLTTPSAANSPGGVYGPEALRGLGGLNPTGDGSDLPTDAVAPNLRPFKQRHLDDAMEFVWNRSGRMPKIAFMGGTQKRAFSMFDGVGNKGAAPGLAAAENIGRVDRAEGVIYATADVFMSNFGKLMAVPTRHIRKATGFDREVFLVDPEYIKHSTLRPWQQFDIAVLGDSRQRMLLVEWCLEVGNQDPHTIIADLRDQS